MEHGGLLSHSQWPATCPYPEPDHSSLRLPIALSEDPYGLTCFGRNGSDLLGCRPKYTRDNCNVLNLDSNDSCPLTQIVFYIKIMYDLWTLFNLHYF